MKKIIVYVCILISAPLQARIISDINIPEITSHSEQSTKLLLNGAGIRTKFIFDIYIGSLYLEKKCTTPLAAYQLHGEKKVSMHFLYNEVSRDKLISGWVDGFKNNHSQTEFDKLEPRLKQFNSFFNTVKKNDVIDFNFIPTTGTLVYINQKMVGEIKGDDFFTALLKVWLGDKPADAQLKNAMLGNDSEYY